MVSRRPFGARGRTSDLEGDGDEPISAGGPRSAAAFAAGAVRADEPAKPDEAAKALAAARDKGLDWLTKNQNADGSWGKTYTVAVTSFACLSYLSAADEPFDGDRGKALVKGLQFLMASRRTASSRSRATPGSTARASARWPCRRPTAGRCCARPSRTWT